MTFLTVAEYQEFLTAEFSGVNPEFVGSIFFQPSQLEDSEIHRVERLLEIAELPPDFTRLIKTYDFGNLYIANVRFGDEDTGCLNWLLEYNNRESMGFESFIDELRAHSLLVIANGDPFAILLDVNTGCITALSAEESISNRIHVANSFTSFIQGMITAFVAKRKGCSLEFQALAQKEFGSNAYPFWEEISS